MVQVAQSTQSEQKYVTDGSHVYHYNEHLDELLARGDLKYCERPLVPKARKPSFQILPDEPMMEDAQFALASGLDADDDKDGHGQSAS
jgi:hypothetical protein